MGYFHNNIDQSNCKITVQNTVVGVIEWLYYDRNEDKIKFPTAFMWLYKWTLTGCSFPSLGPSIIFICQGTTSHLSHRLNIY